jgi:DNA gyrase subunit A
VAQQDMDGVVATIRAADDTAGARAALMSKFGLSQEQSDAILQLQLRRLTALERASLVEEAETLQARRADLQGLLAERSKVLALIGEELAELKSKFDTPRRSQLGSADDADVEDIDLTANEQCIIIRSLKGYVKRMPLAEFEAQTRGTRGKAGANMRDGDAIVQMEQCTTHDTMLCLSDAGVAYALPAYKVPESSRTSRGVLVHQLLPITNQEAIATMLPVRSYSPERYLLLLRVGDNATAPRPNSSSSAPLLAAPLFIDMYDIAAGAFVGSANITAARSGAHAACTAALGEPARPLGEGASEFEAEALALGAADGESDALIEADDVAEGDAEVEAVAPGEGVSATEPTSSAVGAGV